MIQYFLDMFSQMGYFGIIIMMAINFSFIPFPSEVIVPPAGYLASQGEFDLLFVIICCIIGSLLGATFNYYFAFFLGRAVVYKFADSKIGHMLLLNSKKVKYAEDYFNKYGKSSVFIGCLIPAVRQLISLPAGLAKMHFPKFICMTAIGAGIWVTILAMLGYYVGENQVLLATYTREISIVLIAIIIVYVAILIYRKSRKNN